MKFIYIIAILVSTLECSPQEKLQKIEYKAETRGALKRISVNQDSTFYTSLNKKSEVKTSEKDWNRLERLVNTIDLDAIENLDRPSSKSYSDATMSAAVIITLENKSYISILFDDGNPPEVLKEIVNTLFELVSE